MPCPNPQTPSLTPFTNALASLIVCFALVPLASGRRLFLRLSCFAPACFSPFVPPASRRRLCLLALPFVAPPFRAVQGFTLLFSPYFKFEIPNLKFPIPSPRFKAVQ